MITREELDRLERKIDSLNRRLDLVIKLETDVEWMKRGVSLLAAAVVGLIGWMGKQIFGT